MPFWKRNKSQPVVNGEIGYWGLSDWWLSEFTDDERSYIDRSFSSFGSSGDGLGEIRGRLTTGEITFSTEKSPLSVLGGMVTPGNSDIDYSIAERCYRKAEEIGSSDILDLHFLYLSQIRFYYKRRNDHPEALDLAIKACEKQISISKDAAKGFKKAQYLKDIPEHTGYKQLAIIREKQRRFVEAIALSRRAQKQGWTGDWEKRIERLEKKIS